MKALTTSLALLVALIGTPATAADFVQSLRTPKTCAAQMSCINTPTKMSTFAPTTVQSSLNEAQVSRCAYMATKEKPSKTIEFCTTQLKSKTLTAHQRAKLLLVLGTAYAYPQSMEDWNNDPTVSKQVQTWREAIATDPSFLDPYLAAARETTGRGYFPEALEFLDKAEVNHPSAWQIVMLRSQIQHGKGEQHDTLRQAIKAYRIAPSEPEVIYTLGRALFMNGKYQEAIDQLLRVTETFDANSKARHYVVNPNQPWNVVAQIYRNMGKPDKSAEAITEQIKKSENEFARGGLLAMRADYYEMADQNEKALGDIEAAMTILPADVQQGFADRRTALLLKTSARADHATELKSLLARGELKAILNVQVFLRNQGFYTVTINGKYDDATKMALDACLSKSTCKEIIGQSI